MTLGSNIQKIRKEAQMSQEDFAEMFHVSRQTISNWENSKSYPDLEILDRVGGGDSFASGLIYGLMTGHDPEEALNYGAAHGALAMTTPGDTSMASKKEVEAVMSGGSARVKR